jgi:hypothetical protein
MARMAETVARTAEVTVVAARAGTVAEAAAMGAVAPAGAGPAEALGMAAVAAARQQRGRPVWGGVARPARALRLAVAAWGPIDS